MTLIEVITAAGIIALVSLVVISAFSTFLNAQRLAFENKADAEAVEAQIATGEEPFESLPGDLELNGYSLPGDIETYTEGRRSYSVLEGTDPVDVSVLTLYFGDGASVYEGQGQVYETGSAGNTMEYQVTADGRYLLEVWGARGGGVDKSASSGAGYAGGGKGGYAAGVVSLQKSDLLILYAGGIGSAYQTAGEKIGGFNGGGNLMTNTEGGATGGGASDIRIGTDSLDARIIVAGGGGGGGFTRIPSTYSHTPGVITGGAGGGTSGFKGALCSDSWKVYVMGLGGTQSTGGSFEGPSGNASSYNNGSGNNGAGSSYLATNGSFGRGGQGTGFSAGGAGGGGGWYGGGGGCINAAGGGSGWVFTETAYNAWNNTTDKPRYLLDDFGSRYHLSNTSLIAGNAALPDPLASTVTPATEGGGGQVVGQMITGNARGGFVRITYLGN
jgi:hypothetical protein